MQAVSAGEIAKAVAVVVKIDEEVDPGTVKDEVTTLVGIDPENVKDVKGITARETVETFLNLAPLDDTKVANVDPIAVLREGNGKAPRTGTVAFAEVFDVGPQTGKHDWQVASFRWERLICPVMSVS